MLDLHEVPDLLEQRCIVPDRDRTVMRRRFGKPPRHIVVGTRAKSDRRLRSANLHNGTIRGLAFAADELELAVAGVREGLESMKRGEGQPARQILERIRRKHKIPA